MQRQEAKGKGKRIGPEMPEKMNWKVQLRIFLWDGGGIRLNTSTGKLGGKSFGGIHVDPDARWVV